VVDILRIEESILDNFYPSAVTCDSIACRTGASLADCHGFRRITKGIRNALSLTRGTEGWFCILSMISVSGPGSRHTPMKAYAQCTEVDFAMGTECLC
jgi:hypothetical protein